MESRREDTELIAQYVASRDSSLREALILRYVPLVHYVLGRLGMSQSMGADYEDAASQGLIGLIEAVDRYDPSHGTQFSTYATLRIRGRVLDHLRALDWLSRGARQKVRSVQGAINTLWEQLQRAPTNEELVTHLHIDLPQLQQTLVDSSRMMISLDAIIDPLGEEESALHEVLPDDSQPEPSEQVEEDELKQRLVQALAGLSEREQQVLALYYYEELTFKEIGSVLDVSESRICQLHGRAMMNLKAHLARSDEKPIPTQEHGSPAALFTRRGVK